MGYIKHFDSRLKDGTLHVGRVGAKTGDPIDDKDVRGGYEKVIMVTSVLVTSGQGKGATNRLGERWIAWPCLHRRAEPRQTWRCDLQQTSTCP